MLLLLNLSHLRLLHSFFPSRPTLLPAMNPTLSQIITAETPICAELWQIMMDLFNKVNENNKLLKM